MFPCAPPEVLWVVPSPPRPPAGILYKGHHTASYVLPFVRLPSLGTSALPSVRALLSSAGCPLSARWHRAFQVPSLASPHAQPWPPGPGLKFLHSHRFLTRAQHCTAGKDQHHPTPAHPSPGRECGPDPKVRGSHQARALLHRPPGANHRVRSPPTPRATGPAFRRGSARHPGLTPRTNP